ncbi:probable gluconokinase [Erpetoichthys calabaricus]|uniref:Gluconokinase n=1 Tax=Erpetoichthys calabaricus TaxID=27687 RepID=A0A8C4RHM6_ERPCA|nr:probable gluconokinase [Erpetoichthys calabaricus]
MIVVLMGVCGSGKTTIGLYLANKLGWTFHDADDYHPQDNKLKMANGVPLNDQDRIPWLLVLQNIMVREMHSGNHAVLACSALKKAYRRILLQGSVALHGTSVEEASTPKDILFVYLHASDELISLRLAKRKGHFMAESLVPSQFAVLEPPTSPEHFITVDTEKSIADIVAEIEKALPADL